MKERGAVFLLTPHFDPLPSLLDSGRRGLINQVRLPKVKIQILKLLLFN